MKYRVLGKTGLSVSVIGFGTWQFGGEWGRTYAPEDVEKLLAHAKDQGINFIDTAECYGDGLSESLVGRALAGRRQDWIIATKFGHKYNGLFDRTPRWTAREMTEQLERSLANLQTDYIDLYQLHSPKDDLFDNEELWAALAGHLKSGKVRHLGISLSPNDNLRQTEAATRLGAKTLQVLYNRLDRASESRVLPSSAEQGLGVLARVPLASGFLGGRFVPGKTYTFSPDEVRGRNYSAAEVERMIAEVATIRETEVPAGVDIASWALAFCLKHPAVTAVIPGMTSTAQIDSNVRAANLV